MKTKKLSIAIALLAVAVIGTSCGNNSRKVPRTQQQNRPLRLL